MAIAIPMLLSEAGQSKKKKKKILTRIGIIQERIRLSLFSARLEEGQNPVVTLPFASFQRRTGGRGDNAKPGWDTSLHTRKKSRTTQEHHEKIRPKSIRTDTNEANNEITCRRERTSSTDHTNNGA